MKVCYLPLLLILTTLHPPASSWNVLFVSVFSSGSHQTVSGPLANILLKHGHHVTYMSTNIPGYLSNEAEKLKIPDCEALVNGFGSGRNETAEPDSAMGRFRKVVNKLDKSLGACERFYNEPNVQKLMNSGRKFDLFLTFSIYYEVCALGLAHHLGIANSVLHVTAPYLLPLHITALGLPLQPSSVKIDDILLKGKDHDHVTSSVSARVLNILQRNLFDLLHKSAVNWYIEPVLYEKIPGYPGYKETYKTVKMMLMNIHYHPLVDGPTPFGPGVLALGGSLCTEYDEKEVASYEGLAEFMESSTNGFIFMSFGSVQMDIPRREQQKWLEAFAGLPYKVIWKQNRMKDLPSNVKLFNWLPQQSIFQHPNFKLFITHGGHASKTEIACAGKPMLVVPQFAKDQFYNAVRTAEIGVGDHVLDLAGTSVEVIREKILNLTDGRYDKTLQTVRRQMIATKLTEGQIVGYLDAVVSGNTFLPGYQAWYEYLYLDILFMPVVFILAVHLILKKRKK
ncbi:hypothetical protein ACHWQZ_G004292 [Mnemiopsis leidyi]